MTALEIDKEIVNIATTVVDECKMRLAEIPKDRKTERKAVQIELGVYNLALRAGLLIIPAKERENFLSTRKKVTAQIITRYSKIEKCYNALNENEQERMHAAIHAELFMRDQFSEKWEKELEGAETAKDIAAVFDLRIQLGAIYRIYEEWERWRISRNIFPKMFGA